MIYGLNNMISGIQIILLFFIALLIFRTIRRLRDGVIRRGSFFGWMLIWLLGAVVVIIPETTSRIADIVGVGRGVDVVVYLGLLLLFFLIFKLYNRTLSMEQEITRLVRALALKKEDNDDEGKS